MVTQIGINQCIVCNNIGRGYTVTLPIANTCDGCMIIFFSKNPYSTYISLPTGAAGNFTGYSGSFTKQYSLLPNQMITMFSDGSEFSLFNNSPILGLNNIPFQKFIRTHHRYLYRHKQCFTHTTLTSTSITK